MSSPNRALRSIERSRASELRDRVAEHRCNECDRILTNVQNAVCWTGNGPGQELVNETEGAVDAEVEAELSILDGTEVDGVEVAVCCVSSEKHRVLEVHGKKVLHYFDQTIRFFAVVPLGRNRLVVAVDPSATVVLVYAEERGDGLSGGRFTIAVEFGKEG